MPKSFNTISGPKSLISRFNSLSAVTTAGIGTDIYIGLGIKRDTNYTIGLICDLIHQMDIGEYLASVCAIFFLVCIYQLF